MKLNKQNEPTSVITRQHSLLSTITADNNNNKKKLIVHFMGTKLILERNTNHSDKVKIAMFHTIQGVCSICSQEFEMPLLAIKRGVQENINQMREMVFCSLLVGTGWLEGALPHWR